jgi:hypothetical protein
MTNPLNFADKRTMGYETPAGHGRQRDAAPRCSRDSERAPDLPKRRAEIKGRAKSDSLLGDQEAVCLQVVAGAGFAECYTSPEAFWVDLH